MNSINPGLADWPAMKKRVQESHGKMLTLASAPGFLGVLQEENVAGVNLVDIVTKRVYHPGHYLFWDEAPIPTPTNLMMQSDGFIDLIYDGSRIGTMQVYEKTRRAVKEIRYLNPDGTTDYIEEYAFDGSHYTNMFYYRNDLQEIQFLNNVGQICLRFFFYDKQINLVTVEDPETGTVVHRYNSLPEFYATHLSGIVGPQDTVRIDYMAAELFALKNTKSHNILHLVESPFDDNNEIRGNLELILTDKINYVQTVEMSQAAYNALVMRHYPVVKAKVVTP
ncbi:hypothetical protein L248_0813 [Schleiferilactobacillus shenzhenensis LY-73]|uniref:Uncharacterized protein n=1 Tax=Schleiferilactobacillus shenzhenensis LY-73 TaxID=1231336 RepID=U4TRI9_9LACO|nr:hypothetical protein L248_0813 [Schleiferilactobacillus shenzhenensis LY-73]